ncbi:unnamed protein product [Ectocarpus sp. 8 AP-2014]
MRTTWVSCTAAALLLLEDADVEAFRAKYSMPALSGSHRVGTLHQSSVAHREAPGAPGPVTACADGCGHLLSVGKVGAMTSVSLTRGSVRCLLCKAGGTIDEGDFEGTMQASRGRARLTRILEQDLPLQYEKPQDLSIFGDNVEFQDPVTTLRGKFLYRGMLFFTLLFFRVACKRGSSYFEVTAIDRPTRRTIRTVWKTGAVTVNGRDLFISGVDNFTVGEDGRIARHDSAWDQTWEQVREQVA